MTTPDTELDRIGARWLVPRHRRRPEPDVAPDADGRYHGAADVGATNATHRDDLPGMPATSPAAIEIALPCWSSDFRWNARGLGAD
jgi:hypothetical protein